MRRKACDFVCQLKFWRVRHLPPPPHQPPTGPKSFVFTYVFVKGRLHQCPQLGLARTKGNPGSSPETLYFALYLSTYKLFGTLPFQKIVNTIGGSAYKTFRPTLPPLRDPILLFSHIFTEKCPRLRSMLLQPGPHPLREILDPPLNTNFESKLCHVCSVTVLTQNMLLDLDGSAVCSMDPDLLIDGWMVLMSPANLSRTK